MSRVVVYSMGYRGDVIPYVPIAAELARRGHDVTYVLPREYHPLLGEEPFDCVHSGTDFSPVTLDRYGSYVARWGLRLGGAMLARLYFVRLTIPYLEALFEAVDAQVNGADVVVCHPLASFVSAMACERRSVPWVVGDPYPMLLPSEFAPPVGFPNLGRRANRLVWRLGRSRAVDRPLGTGAFKKFRRRLGLPADAWNMVDGRLSPCLNLGLASPAYIDPLPDWPRTYRLVGFTTWSGPERQGLSEDVAAFVQMDEPPVLVTLGTSAATARPEFFGRVAAALDRLGARGIFLTSNDRVAAKLRAATNRRHGVWPFVPLIPLLPRCRAVIHAGGHGTNALVLAAGLPAAIHPCLVDQLWHARRQRDLGTGVWIRKDLDGALVRLLTDHALADRATALADRLAAEDGTTAACDEIEGLLV